MPIYKNGIDQTRVAVGVYRDIWYAAGAFQPRETDGAEPVTAEYPTNDITLDHYLFVKATEEGIQAQVVLPDEWDLGVIKAKVYWDSAAGASAADGVAWGVRAGAKQDGMPIDAALGIEILTTDTLIAVGDLHISPPTAEITVDGALTKGGMTVVQIVRKVGNAADDMAEAAKLIGVMIQYKEINEEPVVW